MQSYQSFPDLIAAWPSAAALGAGIGQPALNVRAWKQRGMIPAKYWKEVVADAERRGISGVTLHLMAELAEKVPNKTRAA